ncbi:hypothetical protein ABZY09_43490, partial [Streptomyces sp. NPDC002928]|uniref:hypothetical protein n=1 Tax=Streptomyces sp. NPDC002928 TaxID=3154440 RepID=UPI0033BF0875
AWSAADAGSRHRDQGAGRERGSGQTTGGGRSRSRQEVPLMVRAPTREAAVAAAAGTGAVRGWRPNWPHTHSVDLVQELG